jgi:hypothetical protein
MGVFDKFPDEEEPMPRTLSEPKPIEEEHTLPTIQSIEDCTPLTKHVIERLMTPRVISSTSLMMSYLINILWRNPSREGKETQHTREKKYSYPTQKRYKDGDKGWNLSPQSVAGSG